MLSSADKTLKSISLPLLSLSASLLVLFNAYFIVTKKKLLQAKDKNVEEPKPPPMAKEGLFDLVKVMSGNDYPSFIQRKAKELKSYVFCLNMAYLLGYPMFAMIGDVKLARDVLLDKKTIKPADYASFDACTQGVPSVMSSSGHYWHSRRKGVVAAFSSRYVKRMNETASQKVNQWIETKLETYIKNDEAFNVGKEMISVALDAISESAFQYELSEQEKESFTSELDLCLKEFFFKTRFNPLRKVFGLFLKERRRAYVASNYLVSLALKIINSYRQLENPTKDTIIDLIMKNDAYKNDKERAADVIILLIAGHDTTAYSIAWILKEIAKHPKEQEKLRDALLSTESANWSQSKILRNIIKEGIRLHPVSGGGTFRLLGRDFFTDDNLFLKKGSFVAIPYYLLFRNHHVFSDPDSFIPSRWEQPTKEMNDSFIPFALGPQNCLGQSLANSEIDTFIPIICSKFELTLEEEGSSHFELTIKPFNAMIKAKKIKSG